MTLNIESIRSELGRSMFQVVDTLSYLKLGQVNDTALDPVMCAISQIKQMFESMDLNIGKILIDDIEQAVQSLAPLSFVEDRQAIIDSILPILDILNRYLYRLDNNEKCSPLALVNNINQLRSITGSDLLIEYDFFHPSFEFLITYPQQEQPKSKGRLVNECVDMLARLHIDFRSALLNWISKSESDSLERLIDLTNNLQQMRGDPLLQKLWWVAAIYIESLAYTGAGPYDVYTTRVFAQIDKIISEMRRQTDSIVPPKLIEEPLRAMLFAVGKVIYTEQLSDSGKIQQLDKSLGLSHWFNDEVGEIPLFDWNNKEQNRVSDIEGVLPDKKALEVAERRLEKTYEEGINAYEFTKNLIPFVYQDALAEQDDTAEGINFAINHDEELDGYMEDIHNCLNRWRMENVNEVILKNLRENLYALQIHAGKVDRTDIAELSEVSERLLASVADVDSLKQNEGILDLLDEVYDGLFQCLYVSTDRNTKHINSLKKMVLLLIDK